MGKIKTKLQGEIVKATNAQMKINNLPVLKPYTGGDITPSDVDITLPVGTWLKNGLRVKANAKPTVDGGIIQITNASQYTLKVSHKLGVVPSHCILYKNNMVDASGTMLCCEGYRMTSSYGITTQGSVTKNEKEINFNVSTPFSPGTYFWFASAKMEGEPLPATFTVYGISYEFSENSTWYHFIDSAYNDGSFTAVNTKVHYKSKPLLQDGYPTAAGNVIIKTAVYTT